MKKTLLFSSALLCLAFTACDKDNSSIENEEQVIPGAPTASQGVYVLTEGNFYTGVEGGLDVINFSTNTVNQSVFKTTNGRTLGDTPQCGVAYGSKIYLGTSVSNTIEIIDRLTWKSIKQIKVSEVTEGGQPYSMIAHNGKVYMSLYGGNLARLDTLTLSIDKVTPVGNNPDQIALYKNKIYVPISDGMNYPDVGKTAVVVDPQTMEVEHTFNTELNPSQFLVAGGHLFLLCKGLYGSIPSALYEVNDNYTLTETAKATLVAEYGDKVAIVNQPFVEAGEEPITEYKLYNVNSKQLTDWNIERPDYANSIYYDKEADCLLIASYIMSGQYPSYVLPGYINRYDKNGEHVVAKYELGSAGRASIFSLQK
ncbi:MAG: hypothetical protein HDR84_04890 [Bacteroides sp.]|nr:hypothetical protein [Bacteroides sp.]